MLTQAELTTIADALRSLVGLRNALGAFVSANAPTTLANTEELQSLARRVAIMAGRNDAEQALMWLTELHDERFEYGRRDFDSDAEYEEHVVGLEELRALIVRLGGGPEVQSPPLSPGIDDAL